MRKMTCINLKLALVDINAFIEFGENQSICSRDIERKQIFCVNQGPLPCTNVQKMTCKLSQARACQCVFIIKFGENLSNCSQDIEQKREILA